MTGNEVILDTSAAVKLLNDLDLASRFLARVGKVHISATAVGELLYGVMNSARHQSNVPRYQQFIDDCEFVSITRAIAGTYAQIRLQLKKDGVPIPDPDIWIAAAALENNLPLVTTDAHFSSVKNLALFPLDEHPPL
jgi:tRNA(fMet)-specific endonuclease VapC